MFKFFLVVFLFSFTTTDFENTQAKGALDEKNLPFIVFHAMKTNDFDLILNYIPGDPEIEYLKNSAHKKSRDLFDKTEAEGLKPEAKISFEKIIEEGVRRQINWNDSEIIESGIEKADSPDKRISKAWFIIQDRKEIEMKVSFQMVKVKSRWYAFKELTVDN